MTHRWYGRPYDAANCLFGQVAHQDPETIGNDMRLLKAGATAKNWKIIPNLRNQLHCPGTNNCTNGCPTGAKRSMLVTNVPRALARGARVFADCRVERITQSRGTVTGIEGRFVRAGGHRGPRLTVRAQVVVAAGGAVQTPALLARSGLRSGSGLLGRNLTLHPNAKVIAFFDEEVVGWHGVHQAYQVREFIGDGILMTAVNLPPSLVALGLPSHGAGLGQVMGDYNHMITAGCLVEDTGSGRVRTRPSTSTAHGGPSAATPRSGRTDWTANGSRGPAPPPRAVCLLPGRTRQPRRTRRPAPRRGAPELQPGR